MSTNFDSPPIYDPIIKNDTLMMSDIWISWISTFEQTLETYLSQFGIFLPKLTTSQRNSIQFPIEGQMIYNTDILGPQIWRNGQWRTFTTTP